MLWRPFVPAVLAVALGLTVGVLTSVLQAHLDFPWLALVNAVSPWLTTAFVAGALQPRLRHAVVLGLVATAMQVLGYYVTAELRGFDAATYYVLFWTACAVIGGPVLGAAGYARRTGLHAGLGTAASSRPMPARRWSSTSSGWAIPRPLCSSVSSP